MGAGAEERMLNAFPPEAQSTTGPQGHLTRKPPPARPCPAAGHRCGAPLGHAEREQS